MAAKRLNLFYFEPNSDLNGALSDVSTEYDDIGSRVEDILTEGDALEDRWDDFIHENQEYSDEILPSVNIIDEAGSSNSAQVTRKDASGEDGEAAQVARPVVSEDTTGATASVSNECTCKANCLSQFTESYMDDYKLMLAALSAENKDHLDLYITGQLAVVANDSKMTAKSKSTNKERKQLRCSYLHKGIFQYNKVLLLIFVSDNITLTFC